MSSNLIEDGSGFDNTEIFQSNIRQIETTNRLLAHIEDKLNNLIQNKDISSHEQYASSFSKNNASNLILQERNENGFSRGNNSFQENIDPNENFMSNKSFQNNYIDQNNKIFCQNLSPQVDYQQNYLNNASMGNQYQTNSFKNQQNSSQRTPINLKMKNQQNIQLNNQFLNQINNGLITNKQSRSITDLQHNFGQSSHIKDEVSTTNRKRLQELNSLLGRNNQDSSYSQVTSTKNRQMLGGTFEYTKSNSPLNSDQRVLENNMDYKDFDARDFQSQLYKQDKNNNVSLVQKIDRMDKFYENKIQVLCERVNILEKENQHLAQEKNDLNIEIIKLKQNIPQTINNYNSKFQEHLKENKDLETKILLLEKQCSELKLQLQNLEQEKKSTVDNLQKENKELKHQNYKYMDEIQQIKTQLKEKNLIVQNMKNQGSSNSLINYYKGAHQNVCQSSRNHYYGNEPDQNLNIFENSNNILEDMRNKREKLNNKVQNQQKNELNPKVNLDTNHNNEGIRQNSRVRIPQLDMNLQNQTNNEFQQNKIPYQPQLESKVNEISQSFLEQPSTRRNRISFHQNDEIQQIKEELNRQKLESMKIISKITDFKSQNGISSTSANPTNQQNVQAAQLESQLMFENYRLYASQLEKSYEKLESLYQKDVKEKQSRIQELQQSINQNKINDHEEESLYRLQPKLKPTKSRKTSLTKKQTKISNSNISSASIGRSKSSLIKPKKI